jgi:ribonucleoside-diphosphate reductase alpha chain
MQEEYLGIKIDYDRDSLFSESGLRRLQQGYMTDVETSPQQRFAFVASEFASNNEHAQRMYDYISQMWISCSTPVLSYGLSPAGVSLVYRF